jgi:hypothetical protein
LQVIENIVELRLPVFDRRPTPIDRFNMLPEIAGLAFHAGLKLLSAGAFGVVVFATLGVSLDSRALLRGQFKAAACGQKKAKWLISNRDWCSPKLR